MAPNGLKWPKNDPKWLKMAQKWHFWNVAIYAFCQAQIFCCQAPKTILHPWPSHQPANSKFGSKCKFIAPSWHHPKSLRLCCICICWWTQTAPREWPESQQGSRSTLSGNINSRPSIISHNRKDDDDDQYTGLLNASINFYPINFRPGRTFLPVNF